MFLIRGSFGDTSQSLPAGIATLVKTAQLTKSFDENVTKSFINYHSLAAAFAASADMRTSV